MVNRQETKNTIKYYMKNLLVGFLILLVSYSAALSQNIGINATGSTPEASAMLDISSANKGLLIPRVALTAKNTAGPVATPAISLLVYNTATSGTTPNNVVPGFYYWNGSRWIDLLSSVTTNTNWSLAGNSGTNPNNNFVGTTDAVDLTFRTNNSEKARITSSGNLGVGVTNPQAKLDVSGTFKLGTSGTALSNMTKTTVVVNDATAFDYTSTRQISVTLNGVNPNATVLLNPRSALPTGIGVGWCRANGTNSILIGFTNSDATSRSIGNVTFDVTLIQ